MVIRSPRGYNIEALFCGEPSQICPCEDADMFLCTSPYPEIMSVCGKINYLEFGLRPVHLKKLVMLGSRAIARTETIYIRPDMDTLYLSDLFT